MITNLVSVVIPARNEIFLQKTIQDVLKKAEEDIEVIVVLDGYWPLSEEIVEDRRVRYLHYGASRGMRNAINMAIEIANGEFILKIDAHCMFDQGFDKKLKQYVPEYAAKVIMDGGKADQWIVIPRRHRLDAEKWELQEVGKPPVDYEFLSSPSGSGAKGSVWNERTLERMNNPAYYIDENMSFQGSCWFMPTSHYKENLKGMSEEGYGTFVREAQEIGLKTWLGGGKVFTNKLTWYAHLHKGNTYGRMYFLDKFKIKDGNEYCDDFWFNNRWEEAKYDLAWFIERFMPVPTWTPELIDQVRKK